MRVTSEMVKAARALSGWTQIDLAKKAKVSVVSIRRIEGKPGPVVCGEEVYDAVINAFTSKRIQFLFQNGRGVLRQHF